MNAKQEFIQHIKLRQVKCATIGMGDFGFHSVINLKEGHTQEEFDAFIEELDFPYDNGYGGQELFGTIWYTDGTWSDRRDYDGSEWWEYHTCPEISYYVVDPIVAERVAADQEQIRIEMENDNYMDYDIPSDDPEYVIASTSFREGTEETYVFEADETGSIANSNEYGGLALRWGDENWQDHKAAVKQAMFKPYKYVSSTQFDNCVQHLYIRDTQGE